MVDGTLFPCLDWRGRRDLWSVKHGSAGMNVQILVRLNEGLVWASDPCPGSMHDVAALDASGLLEGGGNPTPPGGSATRDTSAGG